MPSAISRLGSPFLNLFHQDWSFTSLVGKDTMMHGVLYGMERSTYCLRRGSSVELVASMAV